MSTEDVVVGSVAEGAPVIELAGVVKHYPVRGRGRKAHGANAVVHAVDGVDLTVRRGESLAIVGESGCGKSTLAKLLVGLTSPTSGQVEVAGAPVVAVDTPDLVARRRVGLVSQSPWSALNRAKTVKHIVTQPLRVHGLVRGDDAMSARAVELLSAVGLPEEYLVRKPRDLSGGELQRLTIARALAGEPEVLVLDEPTASLDVSVKATIVNVLADLRAELGLTYVLITHELEIARHLADRVAVMYLGQVVESGPIEQVMSEPEHPYTRGLLAAAPSVLRVGQVPDTILGGEVPSPITPPTGCRFHTRCPWAIDVCLSTEPPLEPRPGDRQAACLRLNDIPPATDSQSVPDEAREGDHDG